MKRAIIFLGCLVLGPVLGCFLSGTWNTGGSTFWKRIDYFPYSLKTIIAMKPFGREFWVETTENEIYQITYPCSKDQICWMKTDTIPSDSSISDGEPVDYNISDNKCENDNFVYPLFHKITMCITSATHAPDATYTVSLALTSDNKLWIWDNPYRDPFSVMTNILLVTIVSTVIGFFTGLFSLAFSPTKGKHR